MGQSLGREKELPPVCGPTPGRVGGGLCLTLKPRGLRVVDAVGRVQGGAGRGLGEVTPPPRSPAKEGLIGFPVDMGMVWR